MSWRRPWCAIGLVLLASVMCVTTAAGQVVQVTAGDSGVPQSVVERVDQLSEDAIEQLLPHFPGLVPVPFQLSVHDTMASVPAELSHSFHDNTAGLAALDRGLVLIVLGRCKPRPPDDVATVVRHEVVHILLHQYAGPAGPFVPRWVHEGVAQVLAEATYLGASEEDIVFHAATGNMIAFSRLDRRFPSKPQALRWAYAQSFSFVSFLRRQVGMEGLLRAVRATSEEQRFRDAFYREVGASLVDYEHDWIEYLKTGSGAAQRVLLTSCFGLTLVGFLPVLVLAGRRRWNRDRESRDHLAAEEAEEPGPPA